MSDRRYTLRGCACGDAFCAGCDDDAWPAEGDTPSERQRGRSAAALQRWIRAEERRTGMDRRRVLESAGLLPGGKS